MHEQGRNDIATFPELFDGLDQFIAEQTASLKRTSTLLILATSLASVIIFATKIIA